MISQFIILTDSPLHHFNFEAIATAAPVQIKKNDTEVGVVEGSVNLKKIPALEIESETQFYICGPAGFIKKQYQDLVEIVADPATVFFEEFGPQQVSLN